MKILTTNNYEIFAANPFQRKFEPSKVTQLVSKMRANGFPPSMAISVFKARNGTLTINTGHHRLAAARQLGIPVLYVVEDQWTMKQLVDEGVTGSNWDTVAVAQTFARAGNKHYQELLGYVDRGLAINMAASMLYGEGAGSGNARVKIKEGNFIIKTRDHVRKILEIFEQFADRVPAVKHRAFVSAYSKCLMTPEFSNEVFMRRLKANPMMLEKTSNEDQMLKLIEEIYNFKSPNKIPLAYLVSSNSSARKKNFGKPLDGNTQNAA